MHINFDFHNNNIIITIITYTNTMSHTSASSNEYTFLRSGAVSLSGQHRPQVQLQLLHREMTYLNGYNDDDEYVNAWDHTTVDTLWITFHSLLAISFAFIAYFTIRLICNTKEFQEWNATRVILPAVSIFLALECATLAVDEAVPQVPALWATLLYILEALIAPGLFLTTFVVTFLAYRIRSMPFCCVRRRPHNDTEQQSGVVDSSSNLEPLVQPNVLVFGMNCFALALVIVNICVNFDVMWNASDLAGRTGWMTLILEPWEPSFVHIFLALIPMTLVCGVSFYFSGLLFRYGNEFSMTIYSSFLNPWMWPLVGVVAMFGGLLPPSPWFAFTSNLGICIYQVTILRILFEIRQDLGEATELGGYLRACWETPAGVDVASSAVDEVIMDEPSLRTSLPEKTGILRESVLSLKDKAALRKSELRLDSTIPGGSGTDKQTDNRDILAIF